MRRERAVEDLAAQVVGDAKVGGLLTECHVPLPRG
jgi:hypothetical protein